jgi:hypothetical protein
MTRLQPTLQLIEAILDQVPEGFLQISTLGQRVKLNDKTEIDIDKDLPNGRVGRVGSFIYDLTRLTPDQVREWSRVLHPIFPSIAAQGGKRPVSVGEQWALRRNTMSEAGDTIAVRIIDALDSTPGFAEWDALYQIPGDELVLQNLIEQGILKRVDNTIFDPIRLSSRSIRQIIDQQGREAIRQGITEYLKGKPGQTASQIELAEKFGEQEAAHVVSSGGFSVFQVSIPVQPFYATWVRVKGSDPRLARDIASGAEKIDDADWTEALQQSGTTLRPGAKEGQSTHDQVVARTYTLASASKRLGLRPEALENAIRANAIAAFEDPEGRLRLPADAVEGAYNVPDYGEQIAAFETVRARDIALVIGVNYNTLRRRMQRANIKRAEPQWGQVRGQWGLPYSLLEYRETLKLKIEEWRQTKAERVAEENRLFEEQLARERVEAENQRQQRRELRAKLVAAFPTWRHDWRVDQRIVLHVGPPNSGKTHDALHRLSSAASGWYLAPLRLLAFEVFDRLNQRGVPCNLLTGEEYIPVPGATITAATIEMFNPRESGECVVIDEAQMLADPDRGWAWTRALMEAQALEIHVMGPTTIRGLIERMAESAALSLDVVEHQRLASIKVADKSWSLEKLPERTILVAFSRGTVLHLKTELERMKRTVSVVYGNLPPEVRRKQADRFAEGQTEICVATDAVGMGLNLPADYVCFYEVQKFDGKSVRVLTSGEVQQIGGRAGRYGLSQAGEVGATNKHDLKLIEKLFYAEPQEITRARVAPTVEDLELIPGTLGEKLAQWASLQSIPEGLRRLIQTAEMAERIELASLLSDSDVQRLGLAAALKLVNAPTRTSTREYWVDCAYAILSNQIMPLPPRAPARINDVGDLEITETSIACADIYLWLSHRDEFGGVAPQAYDVRETRTAWSRSIDDALVDKLDTARRCGKCGRPLPLGHRFGICNRCFHTRSRGDDHD